MNANDILYLLPRIIRAGLYAFFVISCFLVLLWFVLFFMHSENSYGKCVKLPNGIYLGYEAIMSFDNWRWKPFVVPKFSDGTPLLAEQIWPFRATKTTIYGTFEGRHHGEQKTFLWQEDTGLIFRGDHPAKFDYILAKAGPLLDEKFKGGISTNFHFERLANDPQYGLIDCKTRLFRW